MNVGPKFEASHIYSTRHNYYEILIDGKHYCHTATHDLPEIIDNFEILWQSLSNAPLNFEGQRIHKDGCHITDCSGCPRQENLCDCGAWNI